MELVRSSADIISTNVGRLGGSRASKAEGRPSEDDSDSVATEDVAEPTRQSPATPPDTDTATAKTSSTSSSEQEQQELLRQRIIGYGPQLQQLKWWGGAGAG